MKIPRVIVAGEESGCGKSTVALGLMGAAAATGLAVQGFKTGPDFIDPSYYRAVTGRPGRNLDLWMLSTEVVLELFTYHGAKADLTVIEGVMGLFDGAYPDDQGSTAHLSKVLQAPVLLVLDAWHSSSSLGAKAAGFRTFDPDVRLSGVILNGIAGEAHERAARRAVERAGVPVVGAIPMVPEIRLPERHLGLIPFEEGKVPEARCRQIVEIVGKHLDLSRILQIAHQAPPLPDITPLLFAPRADAPELCLAVARDEAFTFYYEDNIDLLRHWGFAIVEFSPLHDTTLPQADLLYFGGGFPEVFADRLSQNVAMREAVLRFHGAGGRLYAECGGFMYLGETLTTPDGRTFPMVGLLPIRTAMTERLQALKYKEVEVLKAGAFFRPGDRLKGHEFHFSRLTSSAEGDALRSIDSTGCIEVEGIARGNALASYTHLHLASNPALLGHLSARLRSAARGRGEGK
ncbi:MAG: cobyrinate a,c-diamide synthase [Candidatus Methylomirabilales bacterium]